MKKLLVRGIAALVLLALLAAGTALIFIDPIVRATIEKGGTAATGVETKLDGADVALTGSRFDLTGLSVANPPGFSPHFLKLKGAHASWDSGSVFSDPLEIRSIVVDGLELHLERTDKGTNWSPILANLEKLSGPKSDGPAEPAGKGRSIRIDKLEIRGAKALLDVQGLPVISGSKSVELPPIVIENLKSDGTAVEMTAVVVRAVIGAVVEQAAKSGGGIFPDDVLGGLKKDVSAWRGKLDAELKGLGVESGVKAVEDVLKGAGDLFKKKK